MFMILFIVFVVLIVWSVEKIMWFVFVVVSVIVIVFKFFILFIRIIFGFFFNVVFKVLVKFWVFVLIFFWLIMFFLCLCKYLIGFFKVMICKFCFVLIMLISEVRVVDFFELVGLVINISFLFSLVNFFKIGGKFNVLKVGMLIGMILNVIEKVFFCL